MSEYAPAELLTSKEYYATIKAINAKRETEEKKARQEKARENARQMMQNLREKANQEREERIRRRREEAKNNPNKKARLAAHQPRMEEPRDPAPPIAAIPPPDNMREEIRLPIMVEEVRPEEVPTREENQIYFTFSVDLPERFKNKKNEIVNAFASTSEKIIQEKLDVNARTTRWLKIKI